MKKVGPGGVDARRQGKPGGCGRERPKMKGWGSLQEEGKLK